jgi:hypothetical protein
VALAFACTPGSFAQINGIPPSVTSIGHGRTIPNIPPSVTSLGPLGFTKSCCFGTRTLRPSTSPGHHHHGQGNGNFLRGAVPVGVPVAVPVYPGDYPDEYQDEDAAEATQPEGEASGPTIFEHNFRGTYAPATGESGSAYRLAEPRPRPQANSAANDGGSSDVNSSDAALGGASEPASILVFRDGHKQEVSNYAIISNTLYDLSSGRAHKIPLADLDLDATIRANDDRGVDFTLPVAAKAQPD